MEFISVLAELKGGRVAAQLGDDFRDLILAVMKHGRKGDLTLKLKVEPARITDGSVKEVEVGYELKVTTPKPNHGHTIFFTKEDASLSRQDPAQEELPFEQEQTR